MPSQTLVSRLELSVAERAATREVAERAEKEFDSVADSDFMRRATCFGRELPDRLVGHLTDFRLEERLGATVVSLIDVEVDQLEATPQHWRECPETGPSCVFDFALVLAASMLGDVFGWATQQDGRLVHNVLPIAEDAHEQLGSSSAVLLTWHTEDAFHPMRADFLALLCLRNPAAVATTVSSLSAVDFTALDVDTLFEPRFFILPDESHLARNNAANGEAAFDEITRMREQPPPRAVFFGNRDAPYMAIDPYFMSTPEGDIEAAEALRGLERGLEAALIDVCLRPGDLLVVDNLRTVHGRRPFAPGFDGSDRWLKRANITRDLRKSRPARRDALCRLVG